MAETPRKFDQDFKEGAVRLVRATGRPIAQAAKDLGINKRTLGNWLREYYPGFLAAFTAGSGCWLSHPARVKADGVPGQGGDCLAPRRAATARLQPCCEHRCGAFGFRSCDRTQLVKQAMRAETVALLGVLNAVCDSVVELAAPLLRRFGAIRNTR